MGKQIEKKAGVENITFFLLSYRSYSTKSSGKINEHHVFKLQHYDINLKPISGLKLYTRRV